MFKGFSKEWHDIPSNAFLLFVFVVSSAFSAVRSQSDCVCVINTTSMCSAHFFLRGNKSSQWEVWCPPQLLKAAPSVFCCNERGEVWSFPITILDQKSQWGALRKSGGQDSGVLKLFEPEQCCLDQLYDLSAPFRRLCFLFSFTYLLTFARS